MKLLLTFSLLLVCSLAGAQNVEFEKKNFPNDKDGFKTARTNLQLGDEIFDSQNLNMYTLAIPYYMEAQKFNPNNAKLNFRLGVCYLYSAQKGKSLEYFQRSFELDPNIDSYNIHYLIGKGYHLSENWAEAINWYSKQLQMLKREGAAQSELSRIEKFKAEAENGQKLSREPVRVWVDNLGPAINSADPEYAPLLSTDESLLILTTRRETNVGGLKDENDNKPFEDLYFSRNVEGVWSPLQNLGENINSSGHDASSGLSPDGKTLFVFKGSISGGGDIYCSVLEGGVWSKPKALGKNINTPAHESAAALSYDGNELYFISDREGGYGGRDIYVSQWDKQKQDWGVAVNLGPVVNSVYDEDGVFIHPDGKTLYFSSKGHNTIGGSDIFYSEKQQGEWQTPVNIGYPVNSPDDDVFFIVTADGRTAYYSSFREGGYGEKDIYRLTFLGPEKQPVLNVEDELLAGDANSVVNVALEPKVEIKTSKMVLLKGLILDEETKKPVAATIDLTDNATSGIITSFKNDPESGAYLVSLPAGKNYGLNIHADKYLFHSENFNLPDTATFKQYNLIIELKPIKIGKSVVLKNIFFDYNKATVRQESEAELSRLASLLRENPSVRMEISGHTDNVGGDDYNQKLSENRAKAVVDYLVASGIGGDRLLYAGYGKSQPIATNDTPEGRQENRRTEFKIIE